MQAAGGDGIPTRRIAGDAGREYILQTEEDTKAKAALDAGLAFMYFVHAHCKNTVDPKRLKITLFLCHSQHKPGVGNTNRYGQEVCKHLAAAAHGIM